MYNSAIESFVEFCDDMMITQEGLFDKFKKEISIRQAKDVNNLDQMQSRMRGDEPLIHLTGDGIDYLVRIFKKIEKSWNTGFCIIWY